MDTPALVRGETRRLPEGIRRGAPPWRALPPTGALSSGQRAQGRGAALRRPAAGGSSRPAGVTGVTLARVLQKSWSSPFHGIVVCFFFFLVGGWSGGLLVSRCSQKAAINQSGVCTNSHTRPAEGGAEGPGGGAAPPGGAGPGGLGEWGSENQTKCKKVAAARAERNQSLPHPAFFLKPYGLNVN